MKPDKQISATNTSLPPDEEAAHLDDAVIGRAFRWSLFSLIAVAALAAAVIWYANRKPASKPAQLTSLTAPASAAPAQAEIPPAKFTDITASSGITFVHNNGAYGDKLLPETMGGGVAFLDFDDDGAQDLLFINSTWWPPEVVGASGRGSVERRPTTMALYRNDGKGHFTDVTAGSGLDVSFYGMGVAIGDYDNDGKPDVFVTAVGGNHLFHNVGNGKFADVTSAAGLAASSSGSPLPSPPALLMEEGPRMRATGAPVAPGSTTTTMDASICSFAITSAGPRKSTMRSATKSMVSRAPMALP